MSYQPTKKQIRAEARFERESLKIVDKPDCHDGMFFAAAQKIANEIGLTWHWRWSDELVVVWIDGDKKGYKSDKWYEFTKEMKVE